MCSWQRMRAVSSQSVSPAGAETLGRGVPISCVPLTLGVNPGSGEMVEEGRVCRRAWCRSSRSPRAPVFALTTPGVCLGLLGHQFPLPVDSPGRGLNADSRLQSDRCSPARAQGCVAVRDGHSLVSLVMGTRPRLRSESFLACQTSCVLSRLPAFLCFRLQGPFSKRVSPPPGTTFSSFDLTWSCLGISTSSRADSLFPKSFDVLSSTFGLRICLISPLLAAWWHQATHVALFPDCPSVSQPACSHRGSSQSSRCGKGLGSHNGSCVQLSQSHSSFYSMVVFSSQPLGSHHRLTGSLAEVACSLKVR